MQYFNSWHLLKMWNYLPVDFNGKVSAVYKYIMLTVTSCWVVQFPPFTYALFTITWK